jgi:hypothetical protein
MSAAGRKGLVRRGQPYQGRGTVHWLMKRFLVGLLVLGGGYLIFFGGSSEKNLGSKKVTLEIATPQGTVRGSSVFELTHSDAPWWYPSAVTGAFGIKGEAPYVDLGSGRYVFMLLHNNYSQWKSMLQYLVAERERGSTNSRYGDTPILVTFDNIEDANSVREVDRNALDRTLGPGYGPVSMTMTDTKERATHGTLAKRFPALHSAMTAPPPPPPPTKFAWEREREKRERDAAGDITPTPQKPEPVRPNSPRISWGAFDAHPRP